MDLPVCGNQNEDAIPNLGFMEDNATLEIKLTLWHTTAYEVVLLKKNV